MPTPAGTRFARKWQLPSFGFSLLISVLCVSRITVAALASGKKNNKSPSLFSSGQRPTLPNDCYSILDAQKYSINIQQTKKKGLGAFLADDTFIHAGDWIGEYTGEILSRPQVEARYWETRKCQTADRRWKKSRQQRQQGISGDYLFDMGDDIFLDAEDCDISSWCRFMNHAPEDIMGKDDNGNVIVVSINEQCNVESISSRWTMLRKEGGGEEEGGHAREMVMPRLWFVARRDIVSGEELLYDYGDSYWSS